MKSVRFVISSVLLFIAVIVIASCGGSNGSSLPTGSTTTTISGSVFAAPVAGASVVVLDSSGTTTVAGPVTTASDGTFSMTVPVSALTSTLIISSSSGTFIDEATGTSTPAREMTAYVTGANLGSGVNLDPASTIIGSLVRGHGKTYEQATIAFSGAFGFLPDVTVAPRNQPTASATTSQRLAALRAIAFSQLTKDLGLNPTDQFDLLSAIAEDLSDGTLDGMNAASLVSIGTVTAMPEDIINRLERSLVSLLSNTSVNLTGLNPAEIGTLPFGKIFLTNNYKVEYLPGMMPATQGKTSFKIRISNRSNGSPVPGLSLALMPKMYMATMSHATPVDTVTDNGDGTYSCAIYYLMASGPGMGYWELKVMIGGMGGESAVFFPNVGMAMAANTVRTTLKGQIDIISTMTGTENRSYLLFRDGLSGTTGNHTFNLFIATKESMMNFPAVAGGTVLSSPTGTWAVDMATSSLAASTDLSSWVTGTVTNGGHWTVPGLTGLVTGTSGTIYVKLNVNSEDKTTDGYAASGANAYSTFKVMP